MEEDASCCPSVVKPRKLVIVELPPPPPELGIAGVPIPAILEPFSSLYMPDAISDNSITRTSTLPDATTP